MLQLDIRELEIGDEVVECLEHLLDRQRYKGSVFNAQAVKVSGMERQTQDKIIKTFFFRKEL